ncbi:MAG: hypothetical protein ACI8WT_005051 [Clostridium sp.]|jgi:hypothetical protein
MGVSLDFENKLRGNIESSEYKHVILKRSRLGSDLIIHKSLK